MTATMPAPTHAVTAQPSRHADDAAWVIGQLSPDSERFLAVAPGCLDVMGGIAEYSGALVVAGALAEHACAGAQRRIDRKLRIIHMAGTDGKRTASVDVPLAVLNDGQSGWIKGSCARKSAALPDDHTACCVGTVVESFRENLFASLREGLTVAVATNLEGLGSSSTYAAMSSALLVCLAALAQEIVEPNVAAHIAQTVENDWLNAAVGPASSLCGLVGQVDHFMHLRCDTRTLAGTLRLPDNVRIISVDCGACPADYDEKFTQVRTATFMGRLLIDRIVRHDGLLAGQWDGHLSRISVNDFVERFRDRLPTKMCGREFLERFGETGDRLSQVDLSHQYKIRSRTEHHVYEHARCRQFVEAMSRGARNGSRTAFVEAGKVMSASHWSMGQRCGMGSVQANSLVNRLRKAGPAKGIFGARCAGWQCGATIVTLTDDSEAARQVVDDSIQSYMREYNTPVTIRSGSLPGAMVSGAVRV